MCVVCSVQCAGAALERLSAGAVAADLCADKCKLQHRVFALQGLKHSQAGEVQLQRSLFAVQTQTNVELDSCFLKTGIKLNICLQLDRKQLCLRLKLGAPSCSCVTATNTAPLSCCKHSFLATHHLLGTVPFLLNLYDTQPQPSSVPAATATIRYTMAVYAV